MKKRTIPITLENHKVVEVSRGSQYTGILTAHKKTNKLIVLNNKNLAIEGCYEFENSLIEGILMRDDNVILVMKNMLVTCLNVKEKKLTELIKYNREP